jgi:uncharacterized membrane protein YhaH (DUF805 family)
MNAAPLYLWLMGSIYRFGSCYLHQNRFPGHSSVCIVIITFICVLCFFFSNYYSTSMLLDQHGYSTFLNLINALIVTNMIHRQHVIDSSYTCEECAESFHSREELYGHTPSNA